MFRRFVITACLFGAVLPAQAQIIDHTDIARVASLPQSVMNSIGRQKWFFTHSAVGFNIMGGLSDLRSANPARYQLIPVSVSYSSLYQRAYPVGTTYPGRVYYCRRGDGNWSAKLTIFDNSVRLSGWYYPAINVAINKLSYVDQNADPASYISSMTALAAAYPDTIFVYATMPLTAIADFDNVLRNQYNEFVRTYCINNHKLLYDVADMEAHDPEGVEQTFEYEGRTYQKLYSGYVQTEGTLNTVGRQRMALGWYAVAAAIVPLEISNRAARDFVMNTASSNWRFAVCGKVTVVDSNNIDLDDGSGVTIRVTAPSHNLVTGSIVRAAGVLNPNTNPVSLRSCASAVRVISN